MLTSEFEVPESARMILCNVGHRSADQLLSLSHSLSMVQVGFFEIVAMPLFKSYVEFVPASQPMLDGVKANYQYWHSVDHVHA